MIALISLAIAALSALQAFIMFRNGEPEWWIAVFVSIAGIFLGAFCVEVNIWHWLKLTVKCFLGIV